MSNGTRVCAFCDTELPPRKKGQRGPSKKYCSEGCRKKMQRVNNPERFQARLNERNARIEASKPPRPKCESCGAEMKRRAVNRFCGKPECRHAAYKAKSLTAPRCSVEGCSRPSQARGLCGPCYSYEYRKNTAKHSYVCDWCGVEFSTARKRTRELKFCCRDHVRKYVAKDSGFTEKRAATVRKAWLDKFTKDLVLYVPPRRVPVRRVNPIPPNEAPWKSCNCEICGTPFLSRVYEKACSTACRTIRDGLVKKAAKDRRRALKRNAFVAPVFRLQVFKRDDYRCQLCGGKMEMDAVAPDPLSPTIDHILPLARGGTHEPANVQSAHFLCNATKGDRGGGEQLALIG